MEPNHPSPSAGERDAVHARLRDAVERLRTLTAVVPGHTLRNVNDLLQDELKVGDRVAIRIARWVGSWYFVIGQTLLLAAWTVLNLMGWMRPWDPYPFVLMSLYLSIQAAYIAPLIVMAQNRESERDRLTLHEDFETNRRAAAEVQRILNILAQHGRLLELLLEEQSRKRELASDFPGGRDGDGRESSIFPAQGEIR